MYARVVKRLPARDCLSCLAMYEGEKEFCVVCEDDLHRGRATMQVRLHELKQQRAVRDKDVFTHKFNRAQKAWRMRYIDELAREERRRDEERKKAEEERQREAASRVLASKSLLHYIERRIPKYVAGWVHEDIARRIERFVQQVEAQESPRLMLLVPPRHGKSELASDSGPAWILGHHPDWTVILSSYSENLPTKFSRNIREQLKSEEYRKVFPRGPTLSKVDAGAQSWATEQGGEVRAAGAGGPILGFGAHVFVIDDPIKGSEEADSPLVLDKIYDWATSVAYSRLAPGGGVILIQQRWNDEDLAGRFERRMHDELEEVQRLRAEARKVLAEAADDAEAQREARALTHEADELEGSLDLWDIITYPALAVQDEYLTVEGDIVGVSAGSRPPDPRWRVLRRTGEALHPQRYTRNYFLKLKRANPRRFAAMYQQSPTVDDGDYFKASDFLRYKPSDFKHRKYCDVYCAWDLAIGTKQRNDYTVGVAGAFDHNGDLWLLRRKKGKWGDMNFIAGEIIDLHTSTGASLTGVERTHLEMALNPILKAKMKEMSTFIAMSEGREALKPIADKRTRGRPLQALAQAGKVYVPEGDDWDEFISWLTRFGATIHDDDFDAVAWLGQMVSRVEPPYPPVENVASPKEVAEGASWYDELIEEQGRGMDSFMAA